VAVLEAATLVACLVLRHRLMRRYRASEGELKLLSQRHAVSEPRDYAYHLFISYRRTDFVFVDQVASYCREIVLPAGQSLRVFKDRDTSMIGHPFDLFLLSALANSAVFCPVISVEAMARLVNGSPLDTDFTLVEYVLALHLKAQGRLRSIVPLLVGADVCIEGLSAMWDYLPENEDFKRLRASLPDVIPTASLETALSLLRAEDPHATLAPELEGRTVRELMDAGSAAGSLQLRGLLQYEWHTFEGRQQNLRGLVKVFASVVGEAARDAADCSPAAYEVALPYDDASLDVSYPLLDKDEKRTSA